MLYLAGMFFRSLDKISLGLVVLLCLFSCNKKGDFINEQQIGSGVHYYPIIVNNAFTDTITDKLLNLTDTTFIPGQKIIFEMDYYSQNPLDSLELWAGKSADQLHKVLAVPYNSSLYSPTKFIDTVLFQYTIPPDLKPPSRWYFEAKAVTEKGLDASVDAVINIQ